MQRSTMPIAVLLAALLGLFVAAPVGAATTGTLCGQVTAFTAPTAIADGSITIDGTVEVIDASALGAIDAATLTTLAALAAADATTCLEITANADGDIIDIDFAAQAEICGTVTIDTTTGTYSVAGVLLPPTLVSADLAALLDVAAAAGVDVCADVAVDATTGLIVSLGLTATIELCGEVTLDADGNATVGGVTIDAVLLDASAAALLGLAAEAEGTACASIDAVSSGGDTSIGVTVTIEVCAEVTAITDTTVTLGDVTFVFAGAADADIEVGDVVCVTATTSPTGDPVITDIDATDDEGAAPGAETGAEPGDGAGPLLPNTAVGNASADLRMVGTLLLIAGAVAASARRRTGVPLR